MNKPKTLPASAEKLKDQRVFLGYTQTQTAEMAGIPLRTYQKYEYGQYDLAKSTMAVGLKICLVLNIDPYSIITDSLKELF